MNLMDVLLDTANQRGTADRLYGVMVGIVTNNQDPEGLGRVKVKFPALSDDNESDKASGWRHSFLSPRGRDLAAALGARHRQDAIMARLDKRTP